MAVRLKRLGIAVQETPDGIIIQGGKLSGGEVDSHGDHRIAMAFAMSALRTSGAVTIHDCKNVATSFPDFVELAKHAGLAVEVMHV